MLPSHPDDHQAEADEPGAAKYNQPRRSAGASPLIRRRGHDAVGPAVRVFLLAVAPQLLATGWASDTADLQRACDSGGLNACTELAGVFARGEGIRRSPARAARLLRTACEGGNMAACSMLGGLWVWGEGVVVKDAEEGMALYRRACDGGDGSACFVLGMATAVGAGEKGLRDPEKQAFLGLMTRSCERGHAEACALLASGYSSGEDVPKDAVRAAGLQRRAAALLSPLCEAGEADACLRLTEDPFGNRRREASAQDREHRRRAEALLRMACDGGTLGREGCVGLGSLYLENEALTDDIDAAIGPLERACRGGFYQGCDGLRELASAYSTAPEPEAKAKLARVTEACDVPEPCGKVRPGRSTDPLDEPLGDAPGSTRIRDRWIAKAYDKAAALNDRLEAADTVARMGFPDMVSPMLERKKVHQTLDALSDIQRAAEFEETRRIGPGSAPSRPVPSRSDVEALVRDALRAARTPNDAWARPLRFRLSPDDSKYLPWKVEVLSDGPDQITGTEDDLSSAEPYGAYDERRYAALDFTPAESAEHSIKALEARCAGDDLPFPSCQAAVEIHLAGNAIPKNPGRAIDVYALACNRNIVEACQAAARLLTSGDRVPRDVVKAQEFLVKTRAILEKACAPGARYRSTYAPRLIQMYEEGEGGPRDIPRARALCEWLRAERVNGACPALERLRTARP